MLIRLNNQKDNRKKLPKDKRRIQSLNKERKITIKTSKDNRRRRKNNQRKKM